MKFRAIGDPCPASKSQYRNLLDDEDGPLDTISLGCFFRFGQCEMEGCGSFVPLTPRSVPGVAACGEQVHDMGTDSEEHRRQEQLISSPLSFLHFGLPTSNGQSKNIAEL